jgi:C4-dicarboxylate-specific signal transduction histidine kinase
MRITPAWPLGICVGICLASAAAFVLGTQRRVGPHLHRTDGGLHLDGPMPKGMGELAASLAHELNQPLTAITSNAQAARAYLASGDFQQAELGDILDDIVSDASRASDIVRGVRALVLGEAPRMLPFNVGDVVEQALDMVQANAASRGVTIGSEVAHGLPRAVGDPVEIRLVLLNLIVNALDAVESAHAAGDGKVMVHACMKDGTLRLSVHDNGCGVADGDLERIFRPFYSSKSQGMGIGLSFSRALMERNGGQIRALRNATQGMKFECVLRTGPLAQHTGLVAA